MYILRSVALLPGSTAVLQHTSLSRGIQKSEKFTSDIKKEWSGNVSLWRVTSDNLELVPVDFPLERTHREIYQDAITVSNRIAETLRSLSIEAEFINEEAKAKCKTKDCVGFRIRLYAGSETGEPVVVEIQRRCGSASSFICTCRAILDAAEGKEIKAVTPRRLAPFIKKPIGQMKCLQSIPLTSIKVLTEVEASLDTVLAMIRSKKRDSNILGLENLCSLTDPIKTTSELAISVSKYIVLGDEKYDFREEILNLTEYVCGSDEDFNLSKHLAHMRHLVFNIFANALALCKKSRCLTMAVEDQSWFVETLIPSLLNELKLAQSNTSNAYHAAWCIGSLIEGSDVARQALLEKHAVPILEEAHTIGLRRHELLYTETKRCLECINSNNTSIDCS